MKSNMTKAALSRALREQLKKKPINKIAINDITDACGISRMTFYYHFQDIYDLVEWTFEEETKITLKGKHSYDTWQQGLSSVLAILRGNSEFIYNIYRSSHREQVERFVKRLVERLVREVAEETGKDLGISEEGKNRVSIIYTYALLGVALEWVSTGMKEEPDRVTALTSAIIKGSMRNSLENMARFEKENGK